MSRRGLVVFMDESVPRFRKEEIDSFCQKCLGDNREGFFIKFLNFPNNFRSIGIYDYQVVLYLRRRIFDKNYKDRLFTKKGARFLFVTKDGNFIMDATEGFQSSKKKKKPYNIKFKNGPVGRGNQGLRGKIIFSGSSNHNSAPGSSKKFKIILDILCINVKDGEGRAEIIEKIFQELRSFI